MNKHSVQAERRRSVQNKNSNTLRMLCITDPEVHVYPPVVREPLIRNAHYVTYHKRKVIAFYNQQLLLFFN
jgi:hypothetical protein